MARMLVFTKDPEKFPAGSVVFVQTVGGKTVQAKPGDAVPVAAVCHPTAAELVEAGLAAYDGEDDGASGASFALTLRLREVCADFKLLSGSQQNWTLAQLLEAFRTVKATDDAAMASFAVSKTTGEPDKPAGEVPKAHAGKSAARK